MKRKGNTVFSTAEFVREANKFDRRGSWNGATHAVNCPAFAVRGAKGCLCTKPVVSADVVRVTWDGVSHERLLYDAGRPHAMFSFPRPYPPAPKYVPMHEYMHRISVASCGADLWPKNGDRAKGRSVKSLPAFSWILTPNTRKKRTASSPKGARRGNRTERTDR